MITVQEPAPRAALRALKQPVFDTMECPGAGAPVANLTFFQAPLGQNLNVTGVAKTAAETNLNQAGQLGVPQEFDLFGFNITWENDDYWFEDTGAVGSLPNFILDSVEIYEASVFQFFFGQQRAWLQIPLVKVPHGPFCVTGPGDVAIDTEKYYNIHCGESTKDEFLKFLANDAPISIHSAENFSARIDWPLAAMGLTANGVNSKIKVYLVGVLYAAL